MVPARAIPIPRTISPARGFAGTLAQLRRECTINGGVAAKILA
jgi:hypothetical protein